MITVVEGVLCEYELMHIQYNTGVTAAGDFMERAMIPVQSFNIVLPDVIKHSIKKATGFDLFSKNFIPMTWIKGDGMTVVAERDTLLVPLVSKEGYLIAGEDVYELARGTGYRIEKGATVEVKGEDVLMLGPLTGPGQEGPLSQQ
jgi:hypothetical protein